MGPPAARAARAQERMYSEGDVLAVGKEWGGGKHRRGQAVRRQREDVGGDRPLRRTGPQRGVEVSGLRVPAALRRPPQGRLVVHHLGGGEFVLETSDHFVDRRAVGVVADDQADALRWVVLRQDGAGGPVDHVRRLPSGGDDHQDVGLLAARDGSLRGCPQGPAVDEGDDGQEDGHQRGQQERDGKPEGLPVQVGQQPGDEPERRPEEQHTGKPKQPVFRFHVTAYPRIVS